MDVVIFIFIIIVIILAIAVALWIRDNNKKNKIIILNKNNAIHENMTQQLDLTDENAAYVKPFVLKKFIDKNKCVEIINYSRSKLFDSKTIAGIDKSIRNSQQYWIPKNHPIAYPLFKAASQYFNIPIENAEDLQVVRYQPGQYYNEHHDACCVNDEKCIQFVKRGGQRMLTILIYLNSDFDDGETSFPNLGYKIKPSPGDAIVFFPLAKNTSKCHPYALHAGLPVSRGEKWVSNLWFREKKFE